MRTRSCSRPGIWLLILLPVFSLCGGISSSAQTAQYTVLLHGKSPARVPAVTLNGRDYIALNNVSHSMFPGSTLAGSSEVLTGRDRLRCSPASFFIVRENATGLRMTQMPYPTLEINTQVYVPVLPLCRALQALGWYDVTVNGRSIILRPFTGTTSLATLFSSGLQEPEAAEQKEEVVQSEEQIPEQESVSEKTGNIITGLGHSDPAPAMILNNIYKAIAPAKDALQRVGAMQKSIVTPVRMIPESESEKGAPRADSVPPGRYLLPPDLLRREIDADTASSVPQKDSSHSENILPDIMPGLPLAMLDEPIGEKTFTSFEKDEQEGLLLASNTGSIHIEHISVEDHNDHIELILDADGAIPSFQRPEYTGENLVLRIAGVRNGYAALKSLQKYGIRSVRAEQAEDVLVYRITWSKPVEKCTYSRRTNGLVYSIVLHGMEGSSGRSAEESKKWLLDVIVLDAGHGGKDVGAESVHGHQEKDITLAIVKKLGQLIQENMPQTKIVYTRKDDRFIELYRRGQIANEAGGKLFISVHCNSMPSKPHPANGFEAYILRPGRNEDAVRVAGRENDAIKFEKNQSRYKALNDEQFIVVNMAQSSFVKFSELFASILQQEVGRATSLQSRGVNQAGFFVLVGASMPNVLFETAFLSNTQDEKFIASEKGQASVAEGMFRAIKAYAGKYEHLLEAQK